MAKFKLNLIEAAIDNYCLNGRGSYPRQEDMTLAHFEKMLSDYYYSLDLDDYEVEYPGAEDVEDAYLRFTQN